LSGCANDFLYVFAVVFVVYMDDVCIPYHHDGGPYHATRFS